MKRPLLQDGTLEDIEEMKEDKFRGTTNALLDQHSPLEMIRAKTDAQRENKFRSLYSFQTFKWLILQTQVHQIRMDELIHRINLAEAGITRIQNSRQAQ